MPLIKESVGGLADGESMNGVWRSLSDKPSHRLVIEPRKVSTREWNGKPQLEPSRVLSSGSWGLGPFEKFGLRDSVSMSRLFGS
ncbi:unnamed protein product [Allacma fusca]|uniref:Uncharacterized protein n=1 Tax=Allacma fusca TaxID=39272 RepID=A0A8J2J734_9HEXA|nr:unnamed protein product [Allacma fusca]